MERKSQAQLRREMIDMLSPPPQRRREMIRAGTWETAREELDRLARMDHRVLGGEALVLQAYEALTRISDCISALEDKYPAPTIAELRALEQRFAENLVLSLDNYMDP